MTDYCEHCGGNIAIRNPTGWCDHLYYPAYCRVCKERINQKKRQKESGFRQVTNISGMVIWIIIILTSPIWYPFHKMQQYIKSRKVTITPQEPIYQCGMCDYKGTRTDMAYHKLGMNH